jgi:hypothetical protein
LIPVRSSRVLVAALWIAGVLAAPLGAARASEEDSRTLFAQGRKLRTEGKCEQAITAFRRALELSPSGLGALRNIAECEEKLNMFASARRDWWDLRRAALQTNEPKYDGWEQAAESAYNALDTKVARIVIVLKGERLDRAKVVLDGKPVDPRLLGVEIERDLGTHSVEVFFDNVAPLTKKITLGEGARETVTIEVPSPTRAAPTEKVRPPPDTGSSTLRAAGIAALGVGGAGVVATIVSVVVRAGALNEVKEGCPSYETTSCPTSLEGSYNKGVTASTLVNVFGVVAVAGVGAGVTLLAVSRSSSSAAGPAKPATSAAVGIVPVWGGAGAHAIVRF